MAVPTIFICYRREDTVGHAGRLFDRLAERFGREHVYRDIDKIAAGQDFIVAVREQINRSDVVLVLIGPRWLAATDEEGQWRLADENDLVRVEIATALERNIRVIPVLLQGATMPKAKDLPGELAPLTHRNAAEIRDTSFDADLAQLIEILGPTWWHRLIRTLVRRPVVAALTLLLALLAGLWIYPQIALTPDRARISLSQMGLEYNADAFVERAGENDAQAVKLFLRAGMAPDAEDQWGRTAIMVAAAAGHLDIVRALAGKGVDIDRALPRAARYGQKDVLAFLLSRQPGLVAISEAMVNAAIGSRDAEMVRTLLDKGADVNFKARDARMGNRQHAEPALIVAANELKVNIVSLLLSRGADVNVKGVLERTALHVAISSFGQSDNEEKRRDQMEIVRGLLSKPVDLEARGQDYWQVTPLLLAIDKKQAQIALLLIERGADVHARATYVGRGRPSRSALMLAAESDMPEVVQALLAKGADVNHRNELGETALHVAARRSKGRGHAEVAQALLAAGVEVNARNNKGETALALVAGSDERARNDEFVQALLSRGATNDRE